MTHRLNYLGFGLLFVFTLTLSALGGNLELIEGNCDVDLRLFRMKTGQMEVIQGLEALQKMSQEADLNLWLSGNQYFAMEDVVRAFLQKTPAISSVGVITLPPGKVVKAILKGGWSYQDHDFPFRPDFYATVDMRHLELLSSAGLANRYFVYLHNELSLMVAQKNPKKITGIDNLGRSDLRVVLPNAKTEGIMSSYGKKVLLRHRLWEKLSRPQSHVRFTKVHHREIPDAIEKGEADVGMVWKTENINAKQEGKKIQGVALPAIDSLRAEVNYLLVPLHSPRYSQTSNAYLKFIQSSEGQEAYARHGFVKATPQELGNILEIKARKKQ